MCDIYIDMRFSLILEDLLNEITGEDLHAKYFPKMDREEFYSIIKADPQTKVEADGNVSKVGRYSQMMLNIFRKKGFEIEDLAKLTEYLDIVYKHNIVLDNSKIKSLGDVYELVKGYIAQEATDFNAVLSVLPANEYKVLHDGEQWIIYQPLTEKAACYLGFGTEWCTAWGPYSTNKRYRDRTNHFNRHNQQGPLFILVSKQDPLLKYQYHFESKQFMNAADRPIAPNSLTGEYPELLYFFFPSLIKEVSEEQKRIEIKRIKALPAKYGDSFVEKIAGETQNPFIRAIVDEDVDELKKHINDENFVDVDFLDNNKIDFIVSNITSDLEAYENTASYYSYSINNAYSEVYDYLSNDEEEYTIEHIMNYLKDYYKENEVEITQNLRVKNFDQFYSLYGKIYAEDSKTINEFVDDVAYLSSESYSSIAEKEYEDIINFIDINTGSRYNKQDTRITLNKLSFVMYLLGLDFEIINDICDTINEYCENNNVRGEYEGIYDYEMKYPKYPGSYDFNRYTDSYFEKIMGDVDSFNECAELKRKFFEIKQKYFRNSTVYNNGVYTFILKSKDVNCDTGMISIKYYQNDGNGEVIGSGSNDGVKVDNLVSLLTNHKLFENKLKLTDLI